MAIPSAEVIHWFRGRRSAIVVDAYFLSERAPLLEPMVLAGARAVAGSVVNFIPPRILEICEKQLFRMESQYRQG